MTARWIALAALFAFVTPAAAQTRQPTAPQPPARACGVAGLWTSATTWVTDFSADGRWQTYNRVEEARRGSPANQGTYSVDGATMHFRTLAADNTYRYRVTLTGNACESMRLVLMGDDRQQYQPGFTIDFTRVVERQQ